MSHLLKRFPFLGVINNIQFVSNFFRRMGDERSYANIYEDYSDERYSEFFEQKDPLGLPELKVDFKEKLKSTVDNLLGRLETGMASSSKSDVTMYTGTSGYALLFWMLSRKRKDDTFRDRSIQILEVAFSKLRNRDVTFIIGDPGPLALGAVIYHMRGMTDRSSELVKRIKSMVPDITDLESDLPDEALYGRVGYLYALLFLNHYLQSNTVEDSIIRQVVSAILASGISLAKSERRKVPLMYSWHGSYYLGAAHGISGILYTLLLVLIKEPQLKFASCLLVPRSKNSALWFSDHPNFLGNHLERNLSLVLSYHEIYSFRMLKAREHLTDSELTELVRPTIDFLLSTSFPSGNLPSSLGREKDKLVHWCHGAPGAVYLYSLAYEVFNDERYLDAANKCGDVVWDRGLLRKGYGLCHGVAGNAYTFLCLHQLLNRKTADPKAQHKADSRDVKNLYRACKFAEWCTTYNQHQDRTPDRPFSLFEGLAGTIYFLNDLQDPMEARFPAYAL